jgi:hypothetical protein
MNKATMSLRSRLTNMYDEFRSKNIFYRLQNFKLSF